MKEEDNKKLECHLNHPLSQYLLLFSPYVAVAPLRTELQVELLYKSVW